MRVVRAVSYRGAVALALALSVVPTAANAHSASDAYLTLRTDAGKSGQTRIHGQWDIALRDLDFVLNLDSDGDGHVTWAEVRHQAKVIETYAYQHLKFDWVPNGICSIVPLSQMIDDHADGAYVALFFDVSCASAPKKLTAHYDLFFAIDPSHRAILVLNRGTNISTALLSPDNAKIDLVLE